MPEVETLADIAIELNSRYADIVAFSKKEEKSDIFINILNRLFIEYGERFGFENFSSFKSSIVQVKNNLKKFKKIAQKNLELRCGIQNSAIVIEPKKRKVSKISSSFKEYFPLYPKEGDGAVYPLWQVRTLGLNDDI